MLSVAKGSLVIIDGKEVFWKGVKVEGVQDIVLHTIDGEATVKVDVRGADPVVVADMVESGIKVKVLK